MSTNLRLRPAQASDASAIGTIYLAARKDALPYLPQIHTDNETRAWIRERLVPAATVWVAELEGKVVGFISVNGQTVEHLYVHPDHQRRKIGTTLLDHARLLSPDRLELYTFERNEGARRFYERHGFRAIAFGQENEEGEPDVLYEWSAYSRA